jgi:hypothetical protein
MPSPKRHFAPGDLQFLTSSTYPRAKLFESDRFRLLAAELRSAPACGPSIMDLLSYALPTAHPLRSKTSGTGGTKVGDRRAGTGGWEE